MVSLPIRMMLIPSNIIPTFPRLCSIANSNLAVADCSVLKEREWLWRIPWRRDRFQYEIPIEKQLLSLVSSTSMAQNRDDCWLWKGDSSGVFSVKSTYLWLYQLHSGELFVDDITCLASHKLWKCKAPLKCLVFVWQSLQNAIPCRSLLVRRGLVLDDVNCFLQAGLGGAFTSVFYVSCFYEVMVPSNLLAWFFLCVSWWISQSLASLGGPRV
jgi:hypothetical protein